MSDQGEVAVEIGLDKNGKPKIVSYATPSEGTTFTKDEIRDTYLAFSLRSKSYKDNEALMLDAYLMEKGIDCQFAGKNELYKRNAGKVAWPEPKEQKRRKDIEATLFQEQSTAPISHCKQTEEPNLGRKS